MPNWCSNKLTVQGNRDEVIRFLEIAGNGNSILADALLAARIINPSNEQRIVAAIVGSSSQRELVSFGGHVPEPEFEGDAWYEWRVSNWGVKWNVAELDVLALEATGDDALFQACFQTAWASPEEWLRAVAGIHPTLRVEMIWNEEQGFGGIYESSSGAVEHKDLEPAEIEAIWPEAPYTEMYDDEEVDQDATV